MKEIGTYWKYIGTDVDNPPPHIICKIIAHIGDTGVYEVMDHENRGTYMRELSSHTECTENEYLVESIK